MKTHLMDWVVGVLILALLLAILEARVAADMNAQTQVIVAQSQQLQERAQTLNERAEQLNEQARALGEQAADVRNEWARVRDAAQQQGALIPPRLDRLPPGYHAELADAFILLTAPLQITDVLNDQLALAEVARATAPLRVCVFGADSQAIQRDVAGNEWYGVVGIFCMPPATSKTTSMR